MNMTSQTECPDLKVARRLIQQMKCGDGRRWSHLDFPLAGEQSWNSYNACGDPSVILFRVQSDLGRYGDNRIRRRYDECDVGDAVRIDWIPDSQPAFLEILGPRNPVAEWGLRPRPIWRFKYATCKMTEDNGRSWSDVHYLERIE